MDQLSRHNWDNWRRGLSDLLGPLEFETSAPSFYGNVDFLARSSFSIARTDAMANIVKKGKASMSASDSLRVILPQKNNLVISQDDRRVIVPPDEFAIYDAGKAVEVGVLGQENYLHTILSLDRSQITSRVANFDDLLAKSLSVRDPAMRVFVSTLNEVTTVSSLANAPAPENFYTVLIEALVSALVLYQGDYDPNLSSIRQRVMDGLKRQIRDPHLTLEVFSREAGIGIRTIQRAFQEAGERPWSWVVDQRLTGVASDLRLPTKKRAPITEVAFSWGFNEISNFNRAFKKKFGLSPRQYRRAFEMGELPAPMSAGSF